MKLTLRIIWALLRTLFKTPKWFTNLCHRVDAKIEKLFEGLL